MTRRGWRYWNSQLEILAVPSLAVQFFKSPSPLLLVLKYSDFRSSPPSPTIFQIPPFGCLNIFGAPLNIFIPASLVISNELSLKPNKRPKNEQKRAQNKRKPGRTKRRLRGQKTSLLWKVIKTCCKSKIFGRGDDLFYKWRTRSFLLKKCLCYCSLCTSWPSDCTLALLCRPGQHL